MTEQMERYGREDALRLVRWIENNRDEWRRICLSLTEEDALLPAECRDVIRILRNHGFYQLLIALAYSKNSCIQNAIESSILSTMEKNWNNELFDNTLDTVLDHLGES